MIDISDNGFYIVENDGEITVLNRCNGEWYDHKSGDYASYNIKPTMIFEKIQLPVKDK